MSQVNETLNSEIVRMRSAKPHPLFPPSRSAPYEPPKPESFWRGILIKLGLTFAAVGVLGLLIWLLGLATETIPNFWKIVGICAAILAALGFSAFLFYITIHIIGILFHRETFWESLKIFIGGVCLIAAIVVAFPTIGIGTVLLVGIWWVLCIRK